MSDFTKADGAKIQITFSEPLTGTVTGNQSHFTVSVPEYDMVPGGTLSAVTKAVKSTAAKSTAATVDLTAGALTDVVVSGGKLSLEEV
jgi:hypothetical protein